MKSRALLSALLVALLAGTALQGCATRMEMGAPPALHRLNQLTPHVSSKNDVLLALGEPRGYGAARLDPGFAQQRVWLYEYNVTEGTNIQLTMLLVFFSGEKYDGYMWFADAVNLKAYPKDKGQ